ncbi:hypothetical protein PRUPE_1G144500 [Prunus persica]|uniref:Uncharacterized protein n=1 Tax=Prunus persica TaxID=3760 RepID=M5XVQ9_PRUPE|nr:hypothetical protein PRUPE_1G144500 [Prunus persica]
MVIIGASLLKLQNENSLDIKVKKETLKTSGLIKFNEKSDHKSDGQLLYLSTKASP